MHPIIFKFGKITIYSYGVLLAIAFSTAMIIAMKKAKKEKLDPNIIIDLSLTLILSAILGARSLFVILEWKQFSSNPMKIFYLSDGGLVFYGGLILGAISFWIFCKLKNLNILQFTDIFAPSVAIGQAIGRIGCFFAGCCYGIVTNSAIGCHFPTTHDHLAHIPTQLIESFSCFILFLILNRIYNNKKFNGQVLSSYLIGYSILRFTIEFYRGDDRGGIFFHYLSISQFIGVFGLILGISLYLFSWNSSLIRKNVVKK